MMENQSTDPETTALYLVGWTTVGAEKDANELARLLVRKRLAACTQVEGPVRSHFFWEGECQEEAEFRLWAKTRSDKEAGILELFRTEHPYDTPQWVTVPLHSVATSFGKWMNECLATDETPQ